MFAGGGSNEWLSEKDESLLGTNAASFKDDEVVLNDTVVRESSQGGDVLFSDISISGGVVLGSSSCTLADSVDLFGKLSSVEVS